MKKILGVLLCCTLLIAVFSFAGMDIISAADTEVYSYLLIGLDYSGINTDSLSIASYNPSENHVSVIQIPRDSYCNIGFYQNKLNQLYGKLLSDGLSSEDAFDTLTKTVAELFGIRLRGYVAATTDSFIKFVDSLGGVKMNIDGDFKYFDAFSNIGIQLKVGENLLSGKDALKFVRHRASYVGGDLERLDVQKIFFSGMFSTMYNFVSEKGACKLFNSARQNINSNFSVVDIILMVIKHSSKFKTVEFMYFTLPGKALKNDKGLWYFQINKPASVEAFKKYLSVQDEFDKDGLLILNNDIYNDETVNTRLYHSRIETQKQK
jgi:LCP family protein required for cell wall assembly